MLEPFTNQEGDKIVSYEVVLKKVAFTRTRPFGIVFV